MVHSVDHGEKLFVRETLGVKKTRVTLDFRRALDLHFCAILEHLSSHVGHSLATILLQFNERLYNVILEAGNELLSRVAQWINIVKLG